MNDGNRYGGAHLLIAFLTGCAAGAAVALLTAPQSGSETRDQLKSWGRGVGNNAVRLPGAIRDAYSAASTAAKEAFIEAFERQAAGGSVVES
jgi:gas vesicle protein